ncbi:MAG: phage tail family protein, partial [Candidatus Dadabacteria bacterium]|nr:phage tail family protein [Candidatus Dadabacteria bacterium]
MAFADSIKFNGKSIRDFLTEIIQVRGRGIPRIRRRSSRIIGRHGEFTFGQVYDSRIIKISGYVEGGSHATLMSNIDEIKNLFKMDDQILATGDESISDGVRYGKLEFGDESDRYYRAIYNGTYVLSEISHQWFTNDLKKIEIEFRCDDPFAYATSLSESTMAGSADEFKVFDLGTAENEVIIELNGSVTNPVIVEGDKVGVAHFDYDDDLTDVEVNTVAGNFEEIFGFRTRKSLTSQQSKAIQIVSKDNLYYDRGANINGQNYVNF